MEQNILIECSFSVSYTEIKLLNVKIKMIIGTFLVLQIVVYNVTPYQSN